MPQYPRYNFWYIGAFSGTLANGATTQISILMAQNTVFELHDLRSFCSVDVATNYRNYGFSVKMTDQGTGQLFTSDYVPRALIFGDMEVGRGGDTPIFPIFSGNTTVTFDVLNTSGGNITSLQIAMVGIREQK